MPIPKREETGLNRQRYFFVLLLLNDPRRRQTCAYREAYPECKSAAAARKGAAELMANPKVKLLIDAADQELAEKFDVSRERVMAEIAKVAFFDSRTLFDPSGNLIPVHELPSDVAAVIAGIDVTVESPHFGPKDGLTVLLTKRYKLASKLTALDLLAKILGMYAETQLGELSALKVLLDNIDGSSRGLPTPPPEQKVH